jgi:WD40 repeat protein
MSFIALDTQGFNCRIMTYPDFQDVHAFSRRDMKGSIFYDELIVGLKRGGLELEVRTLNGQQLFQTTTPHRILDFNCPSQDSVIFAHGNDDCLHIRTYNVRTRELISSMVIGDYIISIVRFSQNSEFVAVLWDRLLTVHRVSTGEQIMIWDTEVVSDHGFFHSINFSPTNDVLVCGLERAIVSVSLSDGQTTVSALYRAVRSVSFDGTLVMAHDRVNNRAIILNTRTLEPVTDYDDIINRTQCWSAFTPNGGLISWHGGIATIAENGQRTDVVVPESQAGRFSLVTQTILM